MKRTTLTAASTAVAAAALSLDGLRHRQRPRFRRRRLRRAAAAPSPASSSWAARPSSRPAPTASPASRRTTASTFESYKVARHRWPAHRHRPEERSGRRGRHVHHRPGDRGQQLRGARRTRRATSRPRTSCRSINKEKATDGVKQVAQRDLGQADHRRPHRRCAPRSRPTSRTPTPSAKDCLSQRPRPPTSAARVSTLTVGSANFPENVVLADIYAEALKAAGATVTDASSTSAAGRSTCPASRTARSTCIPEYSGALLQYFDKTATAIVVRRRARRPAGRAAGDPDGARPVGRAGHATRSSSPRRRPTSTT